MTNYNTTNSAKTNAAFLLASKPTMPAYSKQPRLEKTGFDPSAMNPTGRSYPIPSFFEYRARPSSVEVE